MEDTFAVIGSDETAPGVAGRLGVGFLRRVFHDLVRFETELWNAIDTRVRTECDLSLGSFDTMQAIERIGSCRVQDVACELAITVGGASKVIDRLEASRHCWRRVNPGDRRSSIIELTPAGQAMLVQATMVFEAELRARLGAALPVAALEEFGAALAALRSAQASLASPYAAAEGAAASADRG